MKNKKLNILISKDNSPPYYIQIPTWIRQFTLYILPLVLLSLIIVLIFCLYQLQKNRKVLLKHDEFEQTLVENKALTKEIKQTQKDNDQLREKILTIGSDPSDNKQAMKLSLIKLPETFTDQSHKKIISLSQWQWDNTETKSNISFQINNETKEKISGFVFIFQHNSLETQIFPRANKNEQLFQRAYLEGDKFRMTYFKPLDVSFNISPQQVYYYTVFIFSLNGDLLLEEKFGPHQGQ